MLFQDYADKLLVAEQKVRDAKREYSDALYDFMKQAVDLRRFDLLKVDMNRVRDARTRGQL